MDFQGLHCYIDHLAVVQPDVPASLEARTGASWSYQQLHRASLRVAALLAPLLAENGDIKDSLGIEGGKGLGMACCWCQLNVVVGPCAFALMIMIQSWLSGQVF